MKTGKTKREKKLEKKTARLTHKLEGAIESLYCVHSDLDEMHSFWVETRACCRNDFIAGIAELQMEKIREMQCRIEDDELWRDEYGN